MEIPARWFKKFLIKVKNGITSASSRQRFRIRLLYNFNGSRSVSAILLRVVVLKNIFIIIGVAVLNKPSVLGCGLCTTPL